MNVREAVITILARVPVRPATRDEALVYEVALAEVRRAVRALGAPLEEVPW